MSREVIGLIGLIAALALLTGVDIVARYLFNSPIMGTYEITNVTLVVIGSLGIALSTATDEHIRVDVVYERLGPSGQRALRFFAALVGVVVFGLLTWQNAIALWDSVFMFYETTDRLSLPVYPMRLVLTLAFLFSLIISIGHLADLPRRKPEGDGNQETMV